jgi:hypothetical protein
MGVLASTKKVRIYAVFPVRANPIPLLEWGFSFSGALKGCIKGNPPKTPLL